MKKISKLLLCTVALIGFCLIGQAQNSSDISNEALYVKRNVAMTHFKFLGINAKQYAKCLETVNYLEPEKRIRLVMIDREEYADDGQGFDLVANDGILTSKQAVNYSTGQTVIAIGHYTPALNNPLVHDPLFAHTDRVNGVMGKFGIKIKCNVSWESCNDWPPHLQQLCKDITWPFSGGLSITKCSVELTF